MTPRHPWLHRLVTVDGAPHRVDAITDTALHLSSTTALRVLPLAGLHLALHPEPAAQPADAATPTPSAPPPELAAAHGYIIRTLGEATQARIPARDIAQAVLGHDPSPVEVRTTMAPLRASPTILTPGGPIVLTFPSAPPLVVLAQKK